MRERAGSAFLGGFASGAASALTGAAALVYVLHLRAGDTGAPAALTGVWPLLDWIDRNLGYSVPVFALLALAFGWTLGALRRRVEAGAPVERIAHADHLTEIWIGLFFGTGVIWTAIGMRNALLYALGDPSTTAQAGALALLERMVDGGILVALSTTIFGGVGGYLMRLVKTLVVGPGLRRHYAGQAQERDAAVRDSLSAMEGHLRALREGERA